MRALLKEAAPTIIRQVVRQSMRQLTDLTCGYTFKFAARQDSFADRCQQVNVCQPIRVTESLQAKLQNLRIARPRIHGLIIEPGKVFSFWHRVGKASRRRGFQPGRGLKNGKVIIDYGGGLCQLASILYHAALLADLPVLERHNHSIDIYTEETRFTPLGADAAVAFAYKDLRFANPFSMPLQLSLNVQDSTVELGFWASQSLAKCTVTFTEERVDGGVAVKTWRGHADAKSLLRTDFYRRNHSILK